MKKRNKIALVLEEISEPTIAGLNFDLASSDLLMVCGRVGAGKTTLLYSIMSETTKVSGNATVRGKIAYVE